MGDSRVYPAVRTKLIRPLLAFLLFAILVTIVILHHGISTATTDETSKKLRSSQKPTLPDENRDFVGRLHAHAGQDETRNHHSFEGDYTWSRYCRSTSPCIALLSASRHGSVASAIDQNTLATNDKAEINKDATAEETSLAHRILLREGYCAMYGCDVIVDYNEYNANRTMWLSDRGKRRVGPMPPHWNKVASIQRWLPRFDAILWMDMDVVWVDFNTSVYDLFDVTTTVYSNGNPELVLFRRGEMSHCILNNWWYYGTSPGCRYFKYPQNYRSQTQNLDMPWFWFAMLKCSEIYGGGEPYECLNPCNGPTKYVDNLKEDPDHEALNKLWISGCLKEHRSDIYKHTRAIESRWLYNKHFILEMNWGSKHGMDFSESLRCSIAFHCKDRRDMLDWLNRTAEVLLGVGCSTSTCAGANVSAMHDRLRGWSSDRERSDWTCIENFHGSF